MITHPIANSTELMGSIFRIKEGERISAGLNASTMQIVFYVED